jgi:flavin-dependent dehydrogenase
MDTRYNAIVVGARCAGSPTAMLLARRGYKVLLVDRANFPSDTLSTHAMKKPAVALLAQWGLLDRVIASGCPAIPRISFDVGPFALVGEAPPLPNVPAEADADYSPRRTVLDKILVDGAVAAGAELRDNFTVTDLLFDGDTVTGIRGHDARGQPVVERARIVIGADGMHSRVAKAVKAEVYNERPSLSCAYYAYWDGVAIAGAEIYPRPGRAMIAFPTNDKLTCVLVQCAAADGAQFRRDIEGNYFATLELAPSLAARVKAARRAEPFRGTAVLPNFFRRPHGPGWALVGDAGLHRDPIIAQGICDAFRDAALLSEAVDAGLSGRQPLEEALAGYENERNAAAGPMFDLTCQFAAMAPPPPEMQQLFGALRGNQADTDRFIGAIVGTVPIPEFFALANLQRIVGAVAA